MQVVCSPLCAIKEVELKKQKEFDKETRKLKKGLKGKNEYKKEAQKVFNKYIRIRDKDDPCISCGRTEVEWTRGGAWDCGHYLTVGGYPELRFNEDNAHKQCKSCNGGSAKYAKKGKTVSDDYRERLIKKIGIEKVERLEGPHEAKNYTIEDYISIKEIYNQKLKELEGI